ncbi:MAG: triose-phosphate isomerase [Candidatus Falkowbacteria bacterium]
MKKLFIANWKMQLDYKESLTLAKSFNKNFKKVKNEIVVAPDFSSLGAVLEILKKSPLKLGAQNVASEIAGAYTGEVSPKSLKQLGVKYVLIGHSERRLYFKEDASLLKAKLQTSMASGLTPVLCIGENLVAHKAKKTHSVLRRQLEEVLSGLKITSDNSLVIAYEPIWAIGSGQAATSSAVEATHVFIKGVLAEIIGQIPKVLYGGSVSAKNAADFLEWPNVDGLLVGGASLKVDEFSKIVNV